MGRLDYSALEWLFFVGLVLFYGIIASLDNPHGSANDPDLCRHLHCYLQAVVPGGNVLIDALIFLMNYDHPLLQAGALLEAVQVPERGGIGKYQALPHPFRIATEGF